jgi:hypothetical protein
MRSAAIALFVLACASVASAKEVLPFIENDYAKAAARAKNANLPLFVDAWAPW